MSKQAERDYPLKVEQWHLYRKPYNCPRSLREFGVALELLVDLVPPDSWILDLGCGSGWSSLFLGRAGWNVVGVDISERMIAVARERGLADYSPTTFLVADMEELDLERKDFRAVLLFDALHHCPNYAEVLRRAYEHLQPGGCLLLMEPSWLHLYSPHAREATRVYGVTELGFSRFHLGRLLRKVGFRTVMHHHDSGPGYRGVGGFLLANLRLWCSYFFAFPQMKQIVLAVK
jgi:SAM-dependent methyltransferase